MCDNLFPLQNFLADLVHVDEKFSLLNTMRFFHFYGQCDNKSISLIKMSNKSHKLWLHTCKEKIQFSKVLTQLRPEKKLKGTKKMSLIKVYFVVKITSLV